MTVPYIRLVRSTVDTPTHSSESVLFVDVAKVTTYKYIWCWQCLGNIAGERNTNGVYIIIVKLVVKSPATNSHFSRISIRPTQNCMNCKEKYPIPYILTYMRVYLLKTRVNWSVVSRLDKAEL